MIRHLKITWFWWSFTWRKGFEDDAGAVGDGALVHVALPLGALRRGHAVQLLHVRRETPGPRKEAEKTKNNSK